MFNPHESSPERRWIVPHLMRTTYSFKARPFFPFIGLSYKTKKVKKKKKEKKKLLIIMHDQIKILGKFRSFCRHANMSAEHLMTTYTSGDHHMQTWNMRYDILCIYILGWNMGCKIVLFLFYFIYRHLHRFNF